MFIVNNVWRAWRQRVAVPLVAMLISLITVVGVGFAYSIVQAHNTAHTSGLSAIAPNAVIRLTDEAAANVDLADPSTTDDYLELGDYSTYATAASSAGVSIQATFIYSLPARQSDTIEAVNQSDHEDADKTGGEFTLVAFYNAEAQAANLYGGLELEEGATDFAYSGSDGDAAYISREVAEANGLSVGDTFTVGDATKTETTYTFTVAGIYSYTSDSTMQSTSDDSYAKANRNNVIYTTYEYFDKYALLEADSTGWSKPLFTVVFSFASTAEFDTFKSSAQNAGLPEKYEVVSTTIQEYLKSLTPLDRKANIATIMLYTFSIAGVLMLLFIFITSLLRRMNEFSHAVLIGVGKSKLFWQVMFEIVGPTFLGALLGWVIAFFTCRFALGADPIVTPTLAGGLLVTMIKYSLLAIVLIGVVSSLILTRIDAVHLFTRKQVPSTAIARENTGVSANADAKANANDTEMDSDNKTA